MASASRSHCGRMSHWSGTQRRTWKRLAQNAPDIKVSCFGLSSEKTALKLAASHIVHFMNSIPLSSKLDRSGSQH